MAKKGNMATGATRQKRKVAFKTTYQNFIFPCFPFSFIDPIASLRLISPRFASLSPVLPRSKQKAA